MVIQTEHKLEGRQKMKHALQSIGLFGQNQDVLRKMHTHSLDLIEKCGIRFHSDKALEIWHGAGAEIVGNMVKIPGHLVESALKKAPGSFTLCARDARFDLNLDGKHTYYSQDGCAAFTIDFETGVRRRSRREDIEKMALIADYLDTIDIASPTVSAQDVPPQGINAHELEACFANTGKHVITESVASARNARSQIDLAAAVVGGREELRKRPIFSNFVCTVSPLAQDPGGIEAALEFAEAGIPIGIYSMAMAGVTSPVTLAGTMAVLNAEIISALALLQLAVPGAKVFYAGGPATMDLRTGSYTAGSPEALWLRMMVAEMAGFYGLPSIVGAGATSAKVPGAQAAWENTASYILPSLASASLLFGLGLLDGSNLLTYEGIVLDAESGAMVRRLLSDVDLSDDAFATDLIQKLGPGGVFLSQKHTVTHMQKSLSLPLLSDRDSYEDWDRKGKLNRVELARQKVRDILASHQPLPLSENVKQEMKEVVATYSG
jgi:trimethylamine--corrinoid protein Co-methyltransferase